MVTVTIYYLFKESDRHRRRHGQVVVRVHLLHPLVKRAAHDEPHDDFGTLVTAEAHAILDRHAREALRIALDQLEELAIPFLVVEARALADHLVREPPGADHRHLEVFRIALDRPADRASQLVA